MSDKPKKKSSDKQVKSDNIKTNKKSKSRKEKYFKILGIGVVVLAVLLIGITIFSRLGGNGGNATDKATLKVNIYFLNAANNSLEKETREINQGDNYDILNEVLLELEEGPKSTTLKKAIPDDVTVETLKLMEDTKIAEVTFSEEYLDLSLVEEIFARTAIVNTLCELDFIENVHFYVGDKELLKADGNPVGLMDKASIKIEMDEEPQENEVEVLKLYFSDSNAMGLVVEEREIEITTSQSVENLAKKVIEELLKGPQNENLIRTLPAEMKHVDAKMEEGQTLFLDLSRDFITKLGTSTNEQNLAVYSIVNSLTELSGVKKVQFLIESKKETLETVDISYPLEKNEDIILSQ